uniref:Putative secreted protein n=1 Tax=Anopheles darlingi TaxID=43151 RepID=A0A2M4D5S9_ANODA
MHSMHSGYRLSVAPLLLLTLFLLQSGTLPDPAFRHPFCLSSQFIYTWPRDAAVPFLCLLCCFNDPFFSCFPCCLLLSRLQLECNFDIAFHFISGTPGTIATS